MTPQQLAVLVVAATLGVLVALVLLYGRPRRRAEEPLPATFSRGDPDSVLEGPRLNRILVWGFASTVFMTGFLIVYFVAEPFRQVSYSEHFFQVSIDRGEDVWFEEAECAACHGPGGEGGFAATDPSWPAPPINNIYARMTPDDVRRVIEAGRPGTPMPAWAVEFGGPLNDQKVNDTMRFITSIQVGEDEHWELAEDVTDGAQIFERKCAVCHGPDALGATMGHPVATFYAFDLTTSFYRLGLQALRTDVERELQIELEGPPTDEEVDERFAQVTTGDIIEAGEEPVRTTIVRGRPGPFPFRTPMPPWQNRIHDHQIDAVVEYLRGIQRVPPGEGQ